MILCNSDLSEEKQQAYVDVLLSHKVDGVILINMESPPSRFVERMTAENIPTVVANMIDTLQPNMDQVAIDHYRGGYLAGQYLLAANHRHIGCISLSYSPAYKSPRVTGFREALAEAGIVLSAEDLACGNGRYESGYKAMQDLMQRRPHLTAVFVFNDLMALGAIGALHARGMRVPEDISIIGYDNIAYASIFEPALTTIAQPIAAIGQECIALLVERIQQPDRQPTRITLPVELIERSSSRHLAEPCCQDTEREEHAQ